MTLVIHRRDATHQFRWFVWKGREFEVRDAGWGIRGNVAVYDAATQEIVRDDYSGFYQVRDSFAADFESWQPHPYTLMRCSTCGSFEGYPQEDDQWTCAECGDEFLIHGPEPQRLTAPAHPAQDPQVTPPARGVSATDGAT